MKHTKEEILNALHVIKDTCEEISDGACSKCPFSDKYGHCFINEIIPANWNFKKEEESWRAFE